MDVILVSLLLNLSRYFPTTQLIFTCSNLAKEILDKDVKYVQS